MPTPTYDLIEEKVLGSAAASVTFSSIPGTYKDLVLEVVAQVASASGNGLGLQYNGDTGSNYSATQVTGTGVTTTSSRLTNYTFAWAGGASWGWDNSNPGVAIAQIMSYANTNVNKTALSRFSIAPREVGAYVSLWRNTSAITSITAITTSINWNTGSTFRLWGVAG